MQLFFLTFSILLTLMLQAADGKVTAGTVTIGGPSHAAAQQGDDHRWKFLGKFGYTIGTGRYEMRLRLQDDKEDKLAPMPDLEVFLDEEWPRADSIAPCNRALEVPARKSHTMLEVGRFGEWGPWTEGAVYQKVRPHIWYFALSDCRDRFAGGILDSNRTSHTMDYEIRWRQFDDSQFSLEMRYMPLATAIALCGLTALFLRFASKARSFQRSLGQLHPVVYVLGFAMALEWISQVLHLIHLRGYSKDGIGFQRIDMLAEVVFMLSQVASASLLIAISQGYTLLGSKSLGAMDMISPIASIVFLLHVVLVAIAKLQGEQSCKYHENEGLVGWILLSIRFSLFAWFRSGVKMLRLTGGFRLAQFLKSFELAGSVYFLAFPVLFLIVQVFAPYLQHPILQTGLLAMQTASWIWLASLFVSRGSFFEVSELSASLLPGGALWQKSKMY
eukprot:TRINITY_DN67302_c0_g1_i1.p1 TRINITY_DN67302_c0_g1~~TRINITY_DN67302_c0_g1_i1.p1  ORF type:complete len:445 (+),score=59.68 TRINITY_DN67302_c0_g1_i1:148-1482(+)